jgi:Uma2 family endonuclease
MGGTRSAVGRRARATRDDRPRRRRFTVDEYERMIAAGILVEDERLELIEGEILWMAPIGGRHAALVDRLLRRFTALPADLVQVRVQSPIRLPPDSEPEPDLALLRPRPDFYEAAHPGPEDVLLVIEIADTTLAYDRGAKIPMYARAGIPEAWLFDLAARALLVHREPRGGVYRTVRVLRGDDTIAPLAFPQFVLRVGDLLGGGPAG